MGIGEVIKMVNEMDELTQCKLDLKTLREESPQVI